MNAERRIDAHLHIWNMETIHYPWLTEAQGELYRNHLPGEAATELHRAGVDRAVLVQAADSLAETEYLLNVADINDWVGGVVGWVPLETPAAAALELERWASNPKFRGVRHLVHDDPRPDFLLLDGVRKSLSVLSERGVPFDVPDAWPRHLQQVTNLSKDLPDLVIVLDHLGKPPRGSTDETAWAEEIVHLARQRNVFAKLSGLRLQDQPYSVAALEPIWNHVLENFGPERLMWGSDWPVTPHYAESLEVLEQLISTLSRAEQAALRSGSAIRVYGSM